MSHIICSNQSEYHTVVLSRLWAVCSPYTPSLFMWKNKLKDALFTFYIWLWTCSLGESEAQHKERAPNNLPEPAKRKLASYPALFTTENLTELKKQCNSCSCFTTKVPLWFSFAKLLIWNKSNGKFELAVNTPGEDSNSIHFEPYKDWQVGRDQSIISSNGKLRGPKVTERSRNYIYVSENV